MKLTLSTSVKVAIWKLIKNSPLTVYYIISSLLIDDELEFLQRGHEISVVTFEQ